MIDKLLEIQQKLKIWRTIILILTVAMLLISFVGDDQMAVIVLIICFFAIILYQAKHLPTTSYQIFIILQLVYFIFLTGKLLQTLYYLPFASFWAVCKSIYFMATLLLFMVILWRHYQKDQLLLYQDSVNQE